MSGTRLDYTGIRPAYSPAAPDLLGSNFLDLP
jgi:hypothetical protein